LAAWGQVSSCKAFYSVRAPKRCRRSFDWIDAPISLILVASDE